MKEKQRKKRGRLYILCVLAALAVLFLPQQARAEENTGAVVESLNLSISKKGFHPGKGNYLRIKAYIDTTYTDPFWNEQFRGKADVILRIYDKKGNYVFQKKYKDTQGGFLDYKWNGKPSKKNQAKMSASKYVKNGTYTVEVSVYPALDSDAVSTASCAFQVTSKAASGTEGLSEVKTVPVFTGNDAVDYMAEQICKEAGVKASRKDAENVRRIYHWMTVHQKHVHYYQGGSFKKYYKLSSSAKKIKAYKTASDKKYAKGKILYNYDYSLIGTSWCMERRIGVCTDHAAIFKILCNHAGIEAGICSGYYLNRNGTKPPHSWNYAIVDGVTYYYDVDVEIQNYKKGQGDYYWYQKTKEQAKATHQFVTTE